MEVRVSSDRYLLAIYVHNVVRGGAFNKYKLTKFINYVRGSSITRGRGFLNFVVYSTVLIAFNKLTWVRYVR
jgi:hypothetical protein